jgi:hypothetical protein
MGRTCFKERRENFKEGRKEGKRSRKEYIFQGRLEGLYLELKKFKEGRKEGRKETFQGRNTHFKEGLRLSTR